ncbi:MAG: hypothetical protein DLM58_15220 [Pseudonocardiales bacterium]|nr:MAG: hypothetical protein DLM58_15220 [Pseudonocardiales bacterium]
MAKTPRCSVALRYWSVAPILVVRFPRTGGPAMLKMMSKPVGDMGHQGEEHGQEHGVPGTSHEPHRTGPPETKRTRF